MTKVCEGCGEIFEPKGRWPQEKDKIRYCTQKCSTRHKATKGYKRIVQDGKMKLIHRTRAEKALGHPLPPTAIVHHVDGTVSEHSQLVICQDQKYHAMLHQRMRVRSAGGNPNTDGICSRCHLVLPLTLFAPNAGDRRGRQSMCKSCWRDYFRERRQNS